MAIVPGCDLLVFYFCFKCNPLKHTEPGWAIRVYAEPVGKFCLQATYHATVDAPSHYMDPGIRKNIGRNELALDRYHSYFMLHILPFRYYIFIRKHINF